MFGKYICGMITGLAVGSIATCAIKSMCDSNEKKRLKKKAKKLVDKVERYVSENMPFVD